MKISEQLSSRGFTLVETMVSAAIVGVLAIAIYSILYTSTILGAKNTAINNAHEQARTAMLQMTQDMHSAVSPISLLQLNGSGNPAPLPGSGPGAGIAFQLKMSGPLRVVADANAGTSMITVDASAAGIPRPQVGERVIISSHQIEADISAVTGPTSALNLTLQADGPNYPVDGPGSSTPNPSPSPYLIPVSIIGTSSNHITCIITHHCSYIVKNGNLQWSGPTTKKSFGVLGSDITNPTPFQALLSPGGSPIFRIISGIDLATSDPNYTNRGFKAANILLNGQVPTRAQLTAGL